MLNSVIRLLLVNQHTGLVLCSCCATVDDTFQFQWNCRVAVSADIRLSKIQKFNKADWAGF